MTSLVLSPADETRRRGLRRMRTLALSLLLLAAVVFLLTLHRDGAWGFVNAAAEAAMVGALADWFAVTALFRHPLGLPVPHTAIIPNAQGRARAEPAGVRRPTTSSPPTSPATGSPPPTWPGGSVAGWRTRATAPGCVAEVATATGRALRVLHHDEVRSLVWASMLPRLVEEPLSAGRRPAARGDRARRCAPRPGRPRRSSRPTPGSSATSAPSPRVMAARAPWWSPQWLDDKVIDRVHHEALAWVADVRDNPRHPARGGAGRPAEPARPRPAGRPRDDGAVRGAEGQRPHPPAGRRHGHRGCGSRSAPRCCRAGRRGRPAAPPGGEALRSLGERLQPTTSCVPGSTAHVSERGRLGGRHLRPRDRHRRSPRPSTAGTARRPPSGSSCTSAATCSSSGSTAPSSAAWSAWSSTP